MWKPIGQNIRLLFMQDILPWLLGIMVALLAVGLSRQLMRQYTITQELRQLEAAVADVETRNIELHSLLDYVQSSTYIEEQARLRFGLAAEHEQLAVIKNDNSAVDPNTVAPIAAEATKSKRWWSFFFSN